MANNENANKIVYGDEVLMDLTEDTVNPENLLAGETAHDKSGKKIEGSVITHNVVDNLESTSSEDALSANMGRELNETKENKAKVVPWAEWKDYTEEQRSNGEFYVPDAPGGIGLVINDGFISDKTLWSSFRIKQEIDENGGKYIGMNYDEYISLPADEKVNHKPKFVKGCPEGPSIIDDESTSKFRTHSAYKTSNDTSIINGKLTELVGNVSTINSNLSKKPKLTMLCNANLTNLSVGERITINLSQDYHNFDYLLIGISTYQNNNIESIDTNEFFIPAYIFDLSNQYASYPLVSMYDLVRIGRVNRASNTQVSFLNELSSSANKYLKIAGIKEHSA